MEETFSHCIVPTVTLSTHAVNVEQTGEASSSQAEQPEGTSSSTEEEGLHGEKRQRNQY